MYDNITNTYETNTLTREDAMNAFWEARKQASDVPDMTLDEINEEIASVRIEGKK